MFENIIDLVLAERYEIQALLGSGGMASVFRAHDCALDRQVAVKVVRPDLVLSPEITDKFIREARIIASLEHAHVLEVYDQGKQPVEGQTLVYLVMQLASGGTLTERIREGPLTPYLAEHVLSQVCSALDYAHNRRVIHLDLKPDNILFDELGNALVADFGIARLFQTASHVTTRTVAGTPPYMPYEQWLGKHAGRLSDVFALGITLYQVLTGELPDRELTQQGILVHLRYPLPPGIRAVIERATRSDPGRRYHTAGELAQAFTSAVASPDSVPPERDTEVSNGDSHLLPWAEPDQVPIANEESPSKRSLISYVAVGLAALAVIASLAVLGTAQWRWERRAEETLAAISLLLTTSPTGPVTSTATPLPSVTASSRDATLILVPSPTPYLVVPIDRLLVYAGPGENYKVLGEVHRGDRLPLCGRSPDWAWWQ